jgi:GT2 family glycosyltransferase
VNETAIATPQLSVIIVNWNTVERLRVCLRSLAEHLGDVPHEVLVVDNASSDGSPDMVDVEFPAVRLIRNQENVGFGRANNQAMHVANGDWFLLLNSDTALLDKSVGELFQRIRDQRDIGVAHCRLILPDGRLQHSAYRFPNLRIELVENLALYKLLPRKTAGRLLLSGYWDYAEETDVDWVAGAFMLMPRDVFDRIGGFDERLFMYGEDLEWCLRIHEHGWRVRYFPQAQIKHWDHTSADIRWGDERIALCMVTQRDVFRDRHGWFHAWALMAVRALGACLRLAYYSVRRLGGRQAESYGAMYAYSSQALRALLPLLLPRR